MGAPITMQIAEIALFTERVREVTEFYERLLGRAPDESDASKAVFALGNVQLLIHEGSGPASVETALFDEHGFPPDRDHFAFRVPDLDAYCARLRARGIDVEPRRFPWGRSAYLLDPDGRVVELQGGDGSGEP